MDNKDFTVAFLVDNTPKEAFDAINNVRGWWTGDIEGSTEKLDEEFTYRYKTYHYSKQKLTEVIPNKKVVWLITECELNFVSDKNEWMGTKIIFDITDQGGQTQVRFTHEGLSPKFECYGGCSNAWTDYVTNSLRSLITTGKGYPAMGK